MEVWDPERYNNNATVAENLLFGSPVGPVFAIDAGGEHLRARGAGKVGTDRDLLDMGVQVAATMIELFADLPPGHQFFEQFSFISSEDLPEFQPIVAKADKDGVDSLKPDEKRRLMALPFKLIPARHRLGLMNDDLERRLLEARQVFARDLPDGLRGRVEFFVEDAYNAASTIQDNILFGKVAYGQAQVGGKVGRLMAQVIDELGLRETIQEIGLDHYVGVAGSRLSRAQRQKVALARGILKNPDLLVINEATAGLDGASQSQIHNAILEERQGRGGGLGIAQTKHRPAVRPDPGAARRPACRARQLSGSGQAGYSHARVAGGRMTCNGGTRHEGAA